MQSIFRLPWCSEHQIKLSEKANLDKMRPMVGIPALQDLKRKRADSEDAVSPGHRTAIAKKQQLDFARHVPPAATTTSSQTALQAPSCPPGPPAHADAASSPLLPTPANAHASAPLPAASPSQPRVTSATSLSPETTCGVATELTPLQQVIENELNMQILMKHNELRLIEQELAKCQIALEQLRRCELRPYPGTESPSLAVAEGTGPAIAPPPGHSVPSHPAPYGVTDGPYSKHYSQWLLRDPQFDSVPPEALALAEARIHAAGRSTRNSHSSVHVPRKSASKSLGTWTRSADALHSLPNYAAAPMKDKSQPLVLARSTDRQLVKLICNNCQRGNFSSIQGFLNHCRIAHKVDYKSHDAAALDCGRLLDAEERASMPAELLRAHASKPSISRASASAASSFAKVQSALVHPLNCASLPAAAPRPIVRAHAKPVPTLSTPVPSAFRSAPFKASSETPILSLFWQKQNMGGDLAHAVAMAKQKVDLNADLDMMSPDTISDPNSPATPVGPGARMPAGNGYFPRPESRKGFGSTSQRPHPAPIAAAPPRDYHMQSQLSSPQDLPSATLSPNTADVPGMISDHEDDDHSVSEEDTPQVELPEAHRPIANVNRACSDEMEIDIEDEHVDVMGQRGVIIRRNSMLANESHGFRPAGSPSRKMGT